jgi:uncharacterized protein
MPNLLTPGVYIQEVALGPSPIQGVSTSVAGFVGEAQRGPVDTDTGSPTLVTSFADFQRQYGGFVAGKPLAYAVQGFFDNGGQQAYVARVANPGTPYASVAVPVGYDVAILSLSAITVAASTSFTIRASTVVGVPVGAQISLIDTTGVIVPGVVLTVQPGGVNTTAGTLVVQSNVALPITDTPPLTPTAYALRYFTASGPSAFTITARDPGSFGGNVSVLLTPVYLATAVIQGPASPAPACIVSTTAPFEVGGYVELANVNAPGARSITTVSAINPTTNQLTLNAPVNANFGVGDYVRTLGWLLQTYYNGVLVEALSGISSNNTGSDGLQSVNVNSQWVRVPTATGTYPTFAVVPNVGAPGAAVVLGSADLNTITYNPGPLDGQTLVIRLGTATPVTVTFPSPTTGVSAVLTAINAAIPETPPLASQSPVGNLVLTSPTSGLASAITIESISSPAALAALGLLVGTTTSGSSPCPYPFFSAGVPLPLTVGSDVPADETDIIGSDSPPRSGLKALEATDGISIIAAPGWVSGGTGPGGLAGSNDAVVSELIGQAERKQDRFAVFEAIDYSTNANVDVNRILAERGKWNSQYAAMYVPYVEMLDPLSNTTIPMPASGHVIGAYANTDNLRGVFKAPANVVLQNITGFSINIPSAEQDLLNPVGVNVLRNFPGLGNVIWGARTIAADPLWKYVSVRRLFIFIEQSLVQGTRYAVFEPNDLKLWARLRDSVSNFLTTQWQAGALFGATAKQSFFVRVDETTTTEDDQENGIVNILVGIAPVRPAEFIVFQIGQATESVIIAEQGGS